VSTALKRSSDEKSSLSQEGMKKNVEDAGIRRTLSRAGRHTVAKSGIVGYVRNRAPQNVFHRFQLKRS